MTEPSPDWQRVENADEIPSPALLVYPDRVEANVKKAVALAGGPARLRPHVKTHKTPEIVRLQQSLGIHRFKCATIAEAEMLGDCGAQHVLLAYQPVGPNVARLLELIRRFPGTRFAATVDDEAAISTIARAAGAGGATVELLLDLDCGMHRTGVAPDARAVDLYRLIASLPEVTPGGLHAYDGHICDRDPAKRASAARQALDPVRALRAQLLAMNLPVSRTVVGGTPTFPIHAGDPDFECSPGTFVLWDAGYAAMLPDLDFIPAAVVLTRVVGRPGRDRLCLDLGYKAIAAEGSQPCVRFPGLPEAAIILHNEEHLVLETPRAAEFKPGDALYGVPRHICPTVALHGRATVVRSGRTVSTWTISARDRILTI